MKQDGFKEITLLGQKCLPMVSDPYMAGGFAKLLEETAKTGIERFGLYKRVIRGILAMKMIDVILPVMTTSCRLSISCTTR